MFCNPYILKVHGTSILTMFKAFGISFGAMFGITIIDANVPNYSRSKKVLLCTIFLSGTIVFCAYQAELSSALTVPSNKLPFRSPEDLLQTDYRYNYNTLKNIQGVKVYSGKSLSSKFGRIQCLYCNKRYTSRKPLISALI